MYSLFRNIIIYIYVLIIHLTAIDYYSELKQYFIGKCMQLNSVVI